MKREPSRHSDPFAGILGHRGALELLGRVLGRGQVAQAYLFTGPQGVGKRTVALRLARCLMCAHGGCGVCRVCRQVDDPLFVHPDLVVLQSVDRPPVVRRRLLLEALGQGAGEGPVTVAAYLEACRALEAAGLLQEPVPRRPGEDRLDALVPDGEESIKLSRSADPMEHLGRLAERMDDPVAARLLARLYGHTLCGRYESSIGIEQVRGWILGHLGIKPVEAARKVFLIDDAENLTVQAANALLKTLEEPPGHAVIVLITARPSALLPTIRSRCQRVPFQALPEEDAARFLEQGLGVDEDQALRLVRLSLGDLGWSLRTPLEHAEAERLLVEEVLTELLAGERRRTKVAVARLLAGVEGPALEHRLARLRLTCRERLRTGEAGGEARQPALRRLIALARGLRKCEEALLYNADPYLAAEVLLGTV